MVINMNFDKKFEQVYKEIDDLKKEYNNLYIAYKEARNFTEEFLDCCEKVGIKKVGIRDYDESFKAYPFTFGQYESVFADEYFNGWPAIWKVCSDLKIGGGAGNGGQCQLNTEACTRLIDGIYELKDGNWKKIK